MENVAKNRSCYLVSNGFNLEITSYLSIGESILILATLPSYSFMVIGNIGEDHLSLSGLKTLVYLGCVWFIDLASS